MTVVRTLIILTLKAVVWILKDVYCSVTISVVVETVSETSYLYAEIMRLSGSSQV